MDALRKCLAAIFLFAVLSVPTIANAAASSYQIIDLGTFGGTSSNAYAINASGQVAGVAGTSDGNFRAFRYEHGILNDLGTYDINRSRGWGINDNGLVVGDDGYDSLNPKGKAWKNSGAGMSGISTGFSERDSVAFDVNNNGVVVGRNRFPWSSTAQAFYYDSGTYLTGLGTLHPNGNTGASSANAINDAGQITGWSKSGSFQPQHAFLYENGVMSDLGSLGYSASAKDINELGVAVGSSRASRYGQNHAVRFENGTVFDLGTLGGNTSSARAINNHGHIVGFSKTVSGDTHAFLYDGDIMIDLNDLLEEESEWTKLVSANDINNRGEIVGQGLINGEYHAYLITTPPDSDGDGILDQDDSCPSSDLSTSVTVMGCDSGVVNAVDETGCSIADNVSKCKDDSTKHGKFISCVASLMKGLFSSGVVRAWEKGAVISCAGKAKQSWQ